MSPLAVLCVLVAGFATVARAEPPTARDRAVAAIEKLGGTVEVDETRPGKPVVGVDLSRSAVTDADLVLLEALPDLEVLDLRLTSIGDAGVAHLRGAKALRFLNLFRTRLTDAGLDHLAGNAGLETLLVGGTQVTDEGLARLAAFPRLRKLSVFDTQVGDAGLEHLRGLSRLETLLLGKSRVTAAGRERLSAALPNVRFEEKAPREAVLAAVQRFFDTMAERDAAGAAGVLVPAGRFFSARVAEGKSVTRSFTNREYLDGLPREEGRRPGADLGARGEGPRPDRVGVGALRLLEGPRVQPLRRRRVRPRGDARGLEDRRRGLHRRDGRLRPEPSRCASLCGAGSSSPAPALLFYPFWAEFTR